MNIIARYPADQHGTEWIVVDRGPGFSHPFVSATANALSLSHGEWFWGHYFITRREALAHFASRAGLSLITVEKFGVPAGE